VPGFTPADISRVVSAGDPRISPDGHWIAFVVTTIDAEANRSRQRIWVATADGATAPRPLTSGEATEKTPRWSPDGSLLAFVSKGEEGPASVCILPVGGGGERWVVAKMAVGPEAVAWSPDGRRLAYVARDPDPAVYGTPEDPKKDEDRPPRRITRLYYRLNGEGFIVDRPSRLFVVPADGLTAPVPLTPRTWEADGLAWSPDGGHIVTTAGGHDTWDIDLAVDLYLVPAGGGVPERLTSSGAGHFHPSWSPDGSRIAFYLEPDPLQGPWNQRVAVLDLASREVREVSSGLDRNCAPYHDVRPPAWAGPEGLVFAAEDRGNTHLYWVPADGGASPGRLVAGERTVTSWDAVGGTIAFVASDLLHPAELVVADAADEEGGRVLTDLSAGLRTAVELARPRRFTAVGGDGTEIDCWAIPPVGAAPGTRHPTLLTVHGGPFTQYGNRFLDEFHLWSGAGYAVLFCNPRGSSGRTDQWGRAVRWPEADKDPGSGWGGVDADDVMACVDTAVGSLDFVDGTRLGVLGGSYGGYMTSWLIGHNRRFRAAVSERACNDLLLLEQSSDVATAFRGYVGRTHLEAPEAYRRQSPLTYVGDVVTPVMILHSEDDLRCPVDQAESYFAALRLLGREVEQVRFAGESHELSRSGSPTHRRQRAEVILEWFDRHLRADPGRPAGDGASGDEVLG
jgi:dipeptidyl aminopeptidase/acylaminoacyl peptidase